MVDARNLDDVGEAIGKVAERFDAMRQRRKDGYLSSDPVPEDKTLRKTDSSASGYIQQLRTAEKTQDQTSEDRILDSLRSESLAIITEVMKEYALYPGVPKNKADAIDRIDRAFIRRCRFENKIK